MPIKTKTFDCVEMKRKAQERLHVEYEARKNEFSSYYAFLEATANDTAWQREFWARVAAARPKAGE